MTGRNPQGEQQGGTTPRSRVIQNVLSITHYRYGNRNIHVRINILRRHLYVKPYSNVYRNKRHVSKIVSTYSKKYHK